MNEDAIRILVVDDHAIVRQGLRLMLSQLDYIQAVDEADSCHSALIQIASAPPDIVIVDAHLPKIDGIECVRRILAQKPEVKIIMLSGDSSFPIIRDALQAGATAYVIKENSQAELEKAMSAVISEKGYFSPEVAAVVARHFRESNSPQTDSPDKLLLTDHEKRLLHLIAQGKRNKEIAVQLNVTTSSVESYRSRLMAKLGCTSPAELIRFAIREGIARL